MNTRTRTAAACAIGLAAAGANADMIIGQPLVFSGTPQAVTLRYVSSSAGWDGVLWLDASSARDGIETPLFFNHGTVPGTELQIGIFQPGERLDFIYDVISGSYDTFRTTDPVTIAQFSWEVLDPHTTRVGVEDIRLPAGDRDYNDMVFEVHTLSVPGPPGMALLGLVGVLATRRRRGPSH